MTPELLIIRSLRFHRPLIVSAYADHVGVFVTSQKDDHHLKERTLILSWGSCAYSVKLLKTCLQGLWDAFMFVLFAFGPID